MKLDQLQGIGVALVTPFKKDRSVDFEALKTLVNSVLAGGVDFLVVMGTTGENPTLSEEEQIQVLNTVQETAQQKVPLVFGISGNDTQKVVQRIQSTDFQHIDFLLSATPAYNKPSQQGLYAHYKAIAESSPVPIILYNVPGRTGVHLSTETLLRLSNDFPQIVALKEASGNFNRVMEFLEKKPKNFVVLSGDDAYTLPYIALGMQGVISVTANVFPKEYSEMVQAALDFDIEKARKQHYLLLEFTQSLFLENNPAGVKYALYKSGICSPFLRLPLQEVSKETSEIIDNQYNKVLKER